LSIIYNYLYANAFKCCAFFVIAALLLTIYSLKQQHKYDLFYQYQSIPDVYLSSNILLFETGELHGQLTGFVRFEDIEKQPKGSRQYYTITATDNKDRRGSQQLELETYIKMPWIAIRSIGKDILTLNKITGNTYVYTDDSGDHYGIVFGRNVQIDEGQFKSVTSVLLQDGDESSLLLSDTAFRDFMKIFILNE
jgi:hypothetical protein